MLPLASLTPVQLAVSMVVLSSTFLRPSHQVHFSLILFYRRAAFTHQNGLDAQKLNAQFATLSGSSSCTPGQNACVRGAFAQCVAGTFVTTPCAGGLTCVALPLVNSPGTRYVTHRNRFRVADRWLEQHYLRHPSRCCYPYCCDRCHWWDLWLNVVLRYLICCIILMTSTPHLDGVDGIAKYKDLRPLLHGCELLR